MQVATFSVYAYFTAALFGRQFLEPRGEHKSVFDTHETCFVWKGVKNVFTESVGKASEFQSLLSNHSQEKTQKVEKACLTYSRFFAATTQHFRQFQT